MADGYQIPVEPTPEPEAAPAPATAPAAAEPETAAEPEPATATEGVHPLAFSPEEGLPLAPQEVILKKLAGIIALKNGAVLMYTTYAHAFRAPFRDSLFEHFMEHVKDENAALYDFSMFVVSFGGTLSNKVTKPPEIMGGIQEALTNVLQYEKKMLGALRELQALCGEFAGLKLMVEEHLLMDQKHALDARRMLITLP